MLLRALEQIAAGYCELTVHDFNDFIQTSIVFRLQVLTQITKKRFFALFQTEEVTIFTDVLI